jgi:hypothetical protein
MRFGRHDFAVVRGVVVAKAKTHAEAKWKLGRRQDVATRHDGTAGFPVHV